MLQLLREIRHWLLGMEDWGLVTGYWVNFFSPCTLHPAPLPLILPVNFSTSKQFFHVPASVE
ncbi:MAG TPA: hypothetical protein DEF48_25070 [Nostoc sp. UBA8866]|nr:hypothetical protein [Nostoc sp. UBA8866]